MSSSSIPLLIVEDNPVYAEILQRLIPSLDPSLVFNIHWANTAEKALEEIKQRNYDLVLLDYQLPGADGLSVLAHIRELPLLRQPSVIMLTGIGRESVAVQAMKSGARDYLSKDSFDTASLLRAINGVLQRRQLEVQLAISTAELQERNAQLQADLNLAREIQLSLLPQEYPRFPRAAAPETSAIHFCHRYLPADSIGGDFFDILPIADHTAGVFICDVMGHGVRAALITAVIRGLVEELKSFGADPGQFMTQLNRALLSILEKSRFPLFASAFYLVLDLNKSEIRHATAGHPSPLLLPAGGRDPIHSLHHTRPGAALGLFDDTQYTTDHRPLSSGDRVFLYTDGLYEVPNASHDHYGEERLLDAIQARCSLPTPQLFDELLADIRRHAGREPFLDDICLVGVDAERVGEPEAHANP
jgi:sigma-B regulation protein RsbU (phosphoserine phosphatase)